MKTVKKHYPEVSTKPDFPEIEKEVLEYWGKENIFEKSLEIRDLGGENSNEFVFFDGPPFANGLPHYGHILTGFVKDLVPRYQTMKGRLVERGLGWDCHGLPAEMAAEKELGISGREQIKSYGIGKFNEYCRESVLRYTAQWRGTMKRQARWVSFEQEYMTQDIDYMESVIWAFKTLWEKGLLYESVRVLPYSWAAETTVSNFETRLDNSYRERLDPALTVAFTLLSNGDQETPVKALAWTTTPWTLPSNMALCVGEEIDYAVYLKDGAEYVLAGGTEGRLKDFLAGADKVREIKGRDLVGRRYEPLFPFFAGRENAHKILSGDFVSTEEGTGIVHLAPGFGEDDLNVCQANGIDVVCPIDGTARFTKEVPPYEGQLVFDANKPIIADLKARGLIVRHEQYLHNYPHCWRTDEPLIYRTMPSWLLKVTDLNDRMVELNKAVKWVPGHIKDGAFGNWLEGARDWSISRYRFWGTPIPVWKSDDPNYPRIDVYGSLDEIERDFGRRPTDLHRPYIDEFVRPNPDDPTGKSMMRRTEEVFDCWFESGAMPFAHVHYPFERREWFESHFPADFIVEYIAQIRGWFYTLFVLGAALFDRAPFKNVICHGVVLDENNQKLSKRLRNYPDPERVFETLGADSMRWFLISSPILKGANLSIDKDGREIAKANRELLLPLWNTFNFFCLYANSEGIKAEFSLASTHTLDRYVLVKTRELIQAVEADLDAYEIGAACGRFVTFVDVLNNWYVRRSRDRFWGGRENMDAFNTLYTTLTLVMRTAAPFLPLTSEYIYRSLTGERSVHLADWPDYRQLASDDTLLTSMDRVREVCSLAKLIREKQRLRVRQPLASLTVAGHDLEDLKAFASLIQGEVNVKEVHFIDKMEDMATTMLFVDRQKIGPRLGRAMKDVLAAVAKGAWTHSEADGTVKIAGQVLQAEEFEIRLKARDGFSGEPMRDNRALVALDANITPELEKEGHARDFVRYLQNIRKERDFDITTRISLRVVSKPSFVFDALKEYEDYISQQLLAEVLSFEEGDVTAGKESVVVVGEKKIEVQISEM